MSAVLMIAWGVFDDEQITLKLAKQAAKEMEEVGLQLAIVTQCNADRWGGRVAVMNFKLWGPLTPTDRTIGHSKRRALTRRQIAAGPLRWVCQTAVPYITAANEKVMSDAEAR